jgi:hypothetical protein
VPTAVPIDPAKLIEAAHEHANHHDGAGRPRPISLRRAVSSAYYALFHYMCRQAASHLLPSATREDQLQLARSFNHRPIKDVCEWIAGRRGSPHQHLRPVVQSLQGTPMVGVADVFCDLQEARHSADYDHFAPYSKAAALGYIQDAERAMQTLDAQSDRDKQALFSLISLHTKLR